MKKVKVWISTIAFIVILFVLLHSTPTMAIRTHVFSMGYPKAAITSEIIDYQYANFKLEDEKTRGYVFVEPPIEDATRGILDTYLVKKVGFLYFAEFRNDI